MNILAEHIDANGAMRRLNVDLSFPGFVKHLTFAGLGHQRFPFISFRYLAHWYELHQFWSANPRHFSLPHPFINDPTEKNYLSNKIGRGLADFLAKTIYGARYTHCYEDAMVQSGHAIQGPRPDYYCDTLTQQFALEAKGFTRRTVSSTDMAKHKAQSATGPIPVNFNVASIAYGLYSAPKVKFHDPEGDNISYHHELNSKLRFRYYNEILEAIQLFRFTKEESNIRDYILYRHPFGKLFPNVLLHKEIISREWRSNEWLPSGHQHTQSERLYYIDLDGVGIVIE